MVEPTRELTHTKDPDQLDYIDPDTGMIRERTPAKMELTGDQHDLMLGGWSAPSGAPIIGGP